MDFYIPKITEITYEGKQVEPPTPIPWFPDQLAWQMTTPKNVVRRFGPFASFQKFLVSETAVGNISRQEVVSMIPPLVLDVRPGMTVLDLCAAPGSKSAQLIEMVHAGEEVRMARARHQLQQEGGDVNSPEGDVLKQDLLDDEKYEDSGDYGRATGLLIANDVNWKRANMLVHQMKRLSSPNLIVTNHDATMYPSIRLTPLPTTDGSKLKQRYLKFDRILADVPCSGDGTARKNIGVWRDWAPTNPLGLHMIQVRILVRSLQMLKVGGRVVYSTCSMNPIENEAVVAAAMDRCGGLEKVDLIDCSHMLPGLKRNGGVKSWQVMGKDGTCWSSWEEVSDHMATHGPGNLGKLSESLFPSHFSKTIPLERCMRVCAHYQNTGAFFIAVLEKKSEIRARPESSQNVATNKKATPTIPPITAIINELQSKDGSADPAEHIVAADRLVPANVENHIDTSTPAMRQHEETEVLNGGENERKRKLEDDPELPLKRQALADETAGDSTERLVHYPPPPGAQLNLTAHDKEYNAADGFQEKKFKQIFEEPFKYLQPDNEAIQSIYDFYEVNERFPRDRFLVRNAGGVATNNIYYTSALSREILTENEGYGLKFVYAGVKMFVKQDVRIPEVCPWRMQTDGLHLLEAFLPETRVVRVHSKTTFRKILIDMFPKISGGAWKDLGEVGAQALNVTPGCCVLRIEEGEGEDAFR